MVIFVLTAVGVAYGATIAGKKIRRYRKAKRLRREQAALAIATDISRQLAIEDDEWEDDSDCDCSSERDDCSDAGQLDSPKSVNSDSEDRGRKYKSSALVPARRGSFYDVGIGVGDSPETGPPSRQTDCRVSIQPPKPKKQRAWPGCLRVSRD
eukprot:Selendium_serpulae@DN8983_c0_g1_i1.p1